MSLGSNSVILEDKVAGKRYFGATHHVLMELCQKDQRMQPKPTGPKGKMVPYKGDKSPTLYNPEKH